MKRKKSKISKFYKVGDRHYKSLSQLTYAIRKIKNDNEDKRLSKEDELFMIELFKQHYSDYHTPFLQEGIFDFIDVRSDEEPRWKEMGKINYCFWINCIDGTSDRISYTKMLTTDNNNLIIIEGDYVKNKRINSNRTELLEMDYNKQLQNRKWGEKSIEIRKRDKSKCTKCFSKRNLQVHHTYYVGFKYLLPWEYPNDSLITLCEKCHHKEHFDEDGNKLKFNILTVEEFEATILKN